MNHVNLEKEIGLCKYMINHEEFITKGMKLSIKL